MPPIEETAATGATETTVTETPATPAAESKPSMDETIRSTWRELTGGDGDDTGEQPGQTEARARGPDGKFTKGAEKASQEGKPAAQQATDPAAAATADPGHQPLQTAPHDAFPNTWRRELADTWKTLPPTVREEIHRREGDFHNGIRQYRDAATFGQGIAQEMIPYQQIMQQRGVQPRELVRDVFATLNTFATGTDEQKASALLKVAQDYGINLDAVTTLRQRAPDGVAPALAPVLQRIQQVESTLTAQAQEREQLQRAEDEATVQRFINDPKNEHAKTCAKEMAALLTSGQARDLQDAYEQALWLNPETRAALLAKQDKERHTREAAEAAAARKAAGVNVPRRGTPPVTPKPGTMEDTARAVYRDLVGSG